MHSAICENLFSVVVFHRSMVNWRRGALVYVHSAICETYFGVVVFHTSMELEEGRSAHLYICPNVRSR